MDLNARIWFAVSRRAARLPLPEAVLVRSIAAFARVLRVGPESFGRT